MISIITINLNNFSGLTQTVESVWKQSFDDYEYLIIDGNSHDGSQEYIKSIENKIAYWVSEDDDGVYSAMNKGIAKAKGEYMLFLNSGDFFPDKNSLSSLVNVSNGYDLIYGNLIINESDKSWIKRFPDSLSFRFFLKDSLPHPATLVRSTMFQLAGYYNENLRIVSDWEFFMKVVCFLNAKYLHVDIPIAVFNYDGLSSIKNIKLIEAERTTVLSKCYQAFLVDYELADQTERELANLRNSKWFNLRRALKKLGV